VHFIDLTNTLGRLYHNGAVALDPGISPNFLLARFAWAVFPLVRQFLEVGVARTLRLRVIEDGRFKEFTRALSPAEVTAMGPAIRGRNSSPRKRKAAPEVVSAVGLRSMKRRWQPPSPGADAQDSSLDAICLASEERTPQDTTVCADLTANLADTSPATMPVGSSFDLAQLRRSRRPSNPELYCCDYNAAEAVMRAGRPGKKEFGGAHLCLECLGVEYREAYRARIDRRRAWR
jgi:hypothetical protein